MHPATYWHRRPGSTRLCLPREKILILGIGTPHAARTATLPTQRLSDAATRVSALSERVLPLLYMCAVCGGGIAAQGAPVRPPESTNHLPLRSARRGIAAQLSYGQPTGPVGGRVDVYLYPLAPRALREDHVTRHGK